MAVTILFALSYCVFIVNCSDVFGLQAANLLEKAFFLATGLACLILRRSDKFVLAMLCAALLECFLLGAATNYPDFSWGILVFSLNQFVIIYALIAFEPTEQDRRGILTTISWVPVASVVLGVFYQAIGKRPLFGVDNVVGEMRLQGTLIPAFMGGLAMCGAVAALQSAISSRKFIFLLLFVANMLILILTGARAALAVGLFITALSVLSSPRMDARTKFLGVAFGVLAAGLAAVIFGPTLAERFAKAGDSGRSVIWEYVLDLAARYPWTGIGFGHQFYSTPHEIQIQFGALAAHNDYYRLLLELGRIGMPLFYAFLTMSVLHVWNKPSIRRDPIVLVAYLGFLLLSWTDNALAAPPYFPLIIVALVAARGRSVTSGTVSPAPTPVAPGVRILNRAAPVRLLPSHSKRADLR